VSRRCQRDEGENPGGHKPRRATRLLLDQTPGGRRADPRGEQPPEGEDVSRDNFSRLVLAGWRLPPSGVRRWFAEAGDVFRQVLRTFAFVVPGHCQRGLLKVGGFGCSLDGAAGSVSGLLRFGVEDFELICGDARSGHVFRRVCLWGGMARF
jgi:hypothetical protein